MSPYALVPFVALAACATVQRPQVHAERIATFTLPGGATMAAAFSTDGRWLASGGELGDLVVLDTATWQERWRAWPSDHWIGTLAFSPDGTQLACCGRHLTVHDAATGAVQWQIPNTGPRGFAWRADGSRCAYSWGKEVRVRGAAGDQLLASHEFEYPVNTLCYRGDDLFAGDNVGRSWRIEHERRTPELLHDLRENDRDMTRFLGVAWADGVLFELATRGDLRRGEATFPLPGTPYELAVARDGRAFAVGGRQPLVRWWTEAGAAHEDHAIPGEVAALAFHPDGKTLFASTYSGKSLLLAAGKQPVPVPGHDGQISRTALSPDGSVVAMLGKHCVLQPVDGSAAHELAAVYSIAAGRSGSEILVTTDGACRVVDGRTGADVVAVTTATHHMTQAVLGPSQRVLCGLGSECTDLATGERSTLKLPEDVHLWDWRQAARAPDGSWAIVTTGGIDTPLCSLVVTDAAGTVRLAEHRGLWSSVAFSPDSRWLLCVRREESLAFGSLGKPRVIVYDARTLEVLREIPCEVDCLHFLDPHRALIGDKDGIAVLDVETGAIVQRLPELGDRHSFVLADDTRTLLWSNGREVQVYRLTHE